MSSVTFSTAVGGDGSTVTDDTNPTTGLDGGGHRTRFVPALAQTVAVAGTAVAKASEALAYRNTTLGYRNEAAGFKDDAEAAKDAAEVAQADIHENWQAKLDAASDSADLAVGARNAAEGFASDAAASEAAAAASESQAEAARDAAVTAASAAATAANYYATIALGRAAVLDGQTFGVLAGGSDGLTRPALYRRDSSTTQTPIVSQLQSSEYDSSQSAARNADILPNLFTRDQLVFASLPTAYSGTRTLVTSGDEPALSIATETSAGQSRVYWRFPVSALDGLTTFSAAIRIISAGAGTSGEFKILQRDVGGAIIATNIIATGLLSEITSPVTLTGSAIALDPLAVNIDVDLFMNNTGGDKTRTTVVNAMLLRAGSNAAFTPPPADVAGALAAAAAAQSTANAAQTSANTAIAATSGVAPREGSRLFRNSWPDPVFRDVVGSTFSWQNSQTSPLVTKNGVRCIETSTTGVAANRRTLVDVSGFASGKFSMSVVVHEKIGAQPTNGIRVRITANASSAQNNTITGAWTGYPGADMVDTTFYTRLVPTTDITGPTTLVVCEGFAIPAGATHIGLDIRTETTVAAYISHIVIREGSDASYRDEYDAADIVAIKATGSSFGTVAYIDPAGDDTTGLGTAAAPFATLDKAIDAMAGNGTVYVMSGSYGPQSITPSKVKGQIRLIGQRSNLSTGSYDYPVIRCANKLTGITKTTGRTKIYQATVSGLPTLANFNWAYQDGVADPRTLIADADRSPQHRGRTHRLDRFAKLIKPVATVLADALTEMDAEALPMAFVDSGVLYFTVVGGGDGSAADIYLDAATGLIAGSGATRGMAGVLNITGLDVRYGGIDLRPFAKSHVDELSVLGARTNCLDYNVLSYGTLETAAAGSQSGTTGDGLNGHNGARLTAGADLYSHDCKDDGYSDHEGCTSRMQGGLVEYNGGGGLTPAYGADHIASNFVSRRNQQISGRKPGAFCVVGLPSEGGPAESGYDTLALWINCVDIESQTSFVDGGAVGKRATAINCKSIRPTGYGYGVYKIVDCGYIASGTSTAKYGTTVVENTVVVS